MTEVVTIARIETSCGKSPGSVPLQRLSHFHFSHSLKVLTSVPSYQTMMYFAVNDPNIDTIGNATYSLADFCPL